MEEVEAEDAGVAVAEVWVVVDEEAAEAVVAVEAEEAGVVLETKPVHYELIQQFLKNLNIKSDFSSKYAVFHTFNYVEVTEDSRSKECRRHFSTWPTLSWKICSSLNSNLNRNRQTSFVSYAGSKTSGDLDYDLQAQPFSSAGHVPSAAAAKSHVLHS